MFKTPEKRPLQNSKKFRGGGKKHMKQLEGQITFDDLLKEEETNITAKIMNDKIRKLDNIYEVYHYCKYLVSKEKGE